MNAVDWRGKQQEWDGENERKYWLNWVKNGKKCHVPFVNIDIKQIILLTTHTHERTQSKWRQLNDEMNIFGKINEIIPTDIDIWMMNEVCECVCVRERVKYIYSLQWQQHRDWGWYLWLIAAAMLMLSVMKTVCDAAWYYCYSILSEIDIISTNSILIRLFWFRCLNKDFMLSI